MSRHNRGHQDNGQNLLYCHLDYPVFVQALGNFTSVSDRKPFGRVTEIIPHRNP